MGDARGGAAMQRPHVLQVHQRRVSGYRKPRAAQEGLDKAPKALGTKRPAAGAEGEGVRGFSKAVYGRADVRCRNGLRGRSSLRQEDDTDAAIPTVQLPDHDATAREEPARGRSCPRSYRRALRQGLLQTLRNRPHGSRE